MDDKNTSDNNELKLLFKVLVNNFKNSIRKKIGFVLLVPVIVAGAVAINENYRYRQLKDNPQKVQAKENKDLVSEISKFVILPEGEEPTVVTITDPEKLKEQLFFANAQTGDKVLIYTNSRKAILYSPKENKIVEVAPINIGNPSKP